MNRLGRNESLDVSRQDVNYSHFAGRLGGNQLFTLTPGSAEYEEVKERIPDAISASTWREIMDLRAFNERRLWEMAIIEGMGVCLQVWSSGCLGRAIAALVPTFSSGPLAPIIVAAVIQFITISLFTFALGPVTGAHLNPLITMATFVVRLSSFARTVLYIVFQCVRPSMAQVFIWLTSNTGWRDYWCLHPSWRFRNAEGRTSDDARLLYRHFTSDSRTSLRNGNYQFVLPAVPRFWSRSRSAQ